MTITAAISDYVACQDDFYFRKWPVSPGGIVRSGQTIEMECRVSAEDRISISWTLNGELLLNSSRRYQNSTTGDLVIRRADHRLDSGAFACTATNISSGFSIASQPAVLMISCESNPPFAFSAPANMLFCVDEGNFMTIVNLSTSPRRAHTSMTATLTSRGFSSPFLYFVSVFSLSVCSAYSIFTFTTSSRQLLRFIRFYPPPHTTQSRSVLATRSLSLPQQ